MTDKERREKIEAFVAEHGEEMRDFAEDIYAEWPAPIALEEMTEGQRYLIAKMQSEQETNESLAAAGIESLDDLRVEDDDETWTPPDDWPAPREYDDAGAAADLEAREAREAAERRAR